MRKMDEVDIFIRDYFNQKLSEEETRDFQDRYAKDAKFKQLADQIEIEVLGIRSHGRDQLKSKFQSWENEAIENGQDNNSRKFPYLKMGIAASFLLVLIFVGRFLLRTDSEDMFLAYYEPYENFEYTSTRDESAQTTSVKHKAYSAYDAKNYVEALTFFDQLIANSPEDIPSLFFRGVCKIETSAYDQAVDDMTLVAQSKNPYYKDAARWYLSLLNIKLGNKLKAQELLKELFTSQDYQTRANKLMEELSESN